MYDVIVCGARCAGSPTAMLLAQKGYRVLAVDRDTFPSDTISTAYMQADAVVRMERWGLLNRLKAAGTPPIQFLGVGLGPVEMTMPVEPNAYAPRRTVLDLILVEGAREAGAEVREGCSVQGLLQDAGGTVTGVRLQQDGVLSEESAKLVIGADGRNSAVARAVAPTEYDYHQGSACGYYSFFSAPDLDLTTANLYLRGHHAMFFFPTNGNAACFAFEGPAGQFDTMRKDPGAYLQNLLDENVPALGARLRGATQTERWFGLSQRPSFFRKPFGPGWALVGDAGYLKDPLLGDGINDCFRDAELLTVAIDASFAGRESFESAMGHYETTRNDTVRERYQMSLELTQFEDITPEQMMRMGASNASLAQSA